MSYFCVVVGHCRLFVASSGWLGVDIGFFLVLVDCCEWFADCNRYLLFDTGFFWC